ncbi:MAG: GNAT family N-acetyltransferase [Clostridia bacterium]|nr:GNAT family N-acetyltransferase [Clostridia bacterium]
MRKITTERLYLRPVFIEDAEIITSWKTKPLMRKMSTGQHTEITVESQKKDIQKYEGSQDYLVICLKDHTPIGYCRIDWLNDNPGMVWLRFGLGEHRGEGYMYEALKDWFRDLFAYGVVRIDAEVYSFNKESIGLLEKLGFVIEGRRRKAHYDDEGYHDVLVMGLLKCDFTGERC